MKEEKILQGIVVINWLLQLALTNLPVFGWLSDPVASRLLGYDGYSAAPILESRILYYLPIGGFFVASVGLVLLKNWARYLFLALWLYGWFATLLFGIRIALPLQSFVGMAIGTLDGAILALIFISPLQKTFTGRRA